MEEIVIKFEVPEDLKGEFKKFLNELSYQINLWILMKTLEKSKLSKKDAMKIAEEIKIGMAKRHGLI